MAKVLTYDIPNYKLKLKIWQLQGKLITQAMNGTSVANWCNHQVLRIAFSRTMISICMNVIAECLKIQQDVFEGFPDRRFACPLLESCHWNILLLLHSTCFLSSEIAAIKLCTSPSTACSISCACSLECFLIMWIFWVSSTPTIITHDWSFSHTSSQKLLKDSA